MIPAIMSGGGILAEMVGSVWNRENLAIGYDHHQIPAFTWVYILVTYRCSTSHCCNNTMFFNSKWTWIKSEIPSKNFKFSSR